MTEVELDLYHVKTNSYTITLKFKSISQKTAESSENRVDGHE